MFGKTALALLLSAILPNGWLLAPPPGAHVETGTMPQGMALSPDGTTLAVVESGYNPAALGLYRVPDLTRVATISLPGAFGRPVWADATHVVVAGAGSDALLNVDAGARSVQRIALPKGSYPILVAASPDRSTFAVACAGDATVRIGTLATIAQAPAIKIGGAPGGLAFSSDGTHVFATSRASNALYSIDAASGAATHQTVGLHPSAVAVSGSKVYVALTDADALGIYDASDLHPVATVSLRDTAAPSGAIGVSPNAIFLDGDSSLREPRRGKLRRRASQRPAGRAHPSGLVPDRRRRRRRPPLRARRKRRRRAAQPRTSTLRPQPRRRVHRRDRVRVAASLRPRGGPQGRRQRARLGGMERAGFLVDRRAPGRPDPPRLFRAEREPLVRRDPRRHARGQRRRIARVVRRERNPERARLRATLRPVRQRIYER